MNAYGQPLQVHLMTLYEYTANVLSRSKLLSDKALAAAGHFNAIITRDVPLLFIILQVWTFMLHYSLYIIDYTVSCLNLVGRILVSINNYTMIWSSINLYPQSL